MKNININSIEYTGFIGEIPNYCKPVKRYFVTTRRARLDIFYIESFSVSYIAKEINVINIIICKIDDDNYRMNVSKYDIIYCFDNINDCKKAMLLG